MAKGEMAMNRLEALLNDYASADDTGRLHLFLAYREHRDRFMRIELEELSAGAGKRAPRPVRRWLERLHSSFEAI
jgi:hypothetical protein